MCTRTTSRSRPACWHQHLRRRPTRSARRPARPRRPGRRRPPAQRRTSAAGSGDGQAPGTRCSCTAQPSSREPLGRPAGRRRCRRSAAPGRRRRRGTTTCTAAVTAPARSSAQATCDSCRVTAIAGEAAGPVAERAGVDRGRPAGRRPPAPAPRWRCSSPANAGSSSRLR